MDELRQWSTSPGLLLGQQNVAKYLQNYDFYVIAAGLDP